MKCRVLWNSKQDLHNSAARVEKNNKGINRAYRLEVRSLPRPTDNLELEKHPVFFFFPLIDMLKSRKPDFCLL